MSLPFSEYDLIQAISGADTHGNGKCVVSIQPQRCDADGNIVNTDDEYITEKPVVHVFRQTGGFVLVDFVFDSVQDEDLRRMYALLEDFFAATNSSNDDDTDFPLLALTIVPNALNGEYFAVGFNPIFYALTPDDLTGQPNVVRLVFVSSEDDDEIPNFMFLQSDAEELESIMDDADGEPDTLYYS
mgnify:CR=1 FL=1